MDLVCVRIAKLISWNLFEVIKLYLSSFKIVETINEKYFLRHTSKAFKFVITLEEINFCHLFHFSSSHVVLKRKEEILFWQNCYYLFT